MAETNPTPSEAESTRRAPNPAGGEDRSAAPPVNPWRQSWEAIPPAARLAGAGIALAAMVGFGLLIGANTGDYKLVASDMPAEDLRAAVGSLATKGIPYRVEGGRLYVETSLIHDARLELAASPMPSGRSVGFELFDSSELGRSAFSEKVNYHRALEGELARTIGSIAPIASARVHLVMPGDKLFKEHQTQPSASVQVRLERGEALSPKQVGAIRQLVAGAVEKMSPGRVTIVDESGAMVGGPRNPELEAADGAFEHQRQYERLLEGKVVDLLEPVVGVGGVQAKVSARIDFSHVVETQDRVDPDEQAVVSEQTREEQRTATDPAAIGIPGMATNTPDRNPPGAAEGGKQLSNRTENTTNFQASRSSKRVDQPRGRTERLSVAVIVDNERVRGADGTMTVVPRPPEELERYKALVARAIGVDEARGDSIEVVAETLLRPNEDSAFASPEVADEPPSRLMWILGGVAALLLLGLVLGVRRVRRRAKQRELEWSREREALLAAAEPPPPSALPALNAAMQVDQLRLRALQAGSADVRRVATVVRAWLHEDGKSRAGA